jgi:hypothetical protein
LKPRQTSLFDIIGERCSMSFLAAGTAENMMLKPSFVQYRMPFETQTDISF